jgi:hypothetical protein
MPNWSEFTRTATPIGAKPYVTIQRKGTLSLNRAAFEALGKPEAVKLLYDRNERMIGFRPADTEEVGAYPVRPQASSNWLVAGTAFSSFLRLDTSTAKRYEAEAIDGVLAVDLKREGIAVTSPRAKQPVAV